MRHFAAFLVLCSLACSAPVRKDDTCENTCGDACCAAHETCDAATSTCVAACVPKGCAELAKNCGAVDDGCGKSLDCGTCPAETTCGGGGTANVCGRPGCTPANPCQGLGKNCGSADDGCGGVVSCGTCSGTDTCGGGGTDGVCGHPACTPTSCQAEGRNCGPLGDGCGKTLDCGTCSGTDTCGGGGVDGVCGGVACTPTNCAAEHKNCGLIENGCNGTLNCGACSNGETCGGGGTENVCGKPACTKTPCSALGKNCGQIGDGCAGVQDCGTCNPPDTCGGGGVSNVCGRGTTCTGESDATFCARLGKACGSVTAPDNCNHARTASCGTCSAGTCVQNQCCSPETDAALCARNGWACGTTTFVDNCGTPRSVTCGTCAGGATCNAGSCACSDTDQALCARRGNPCGTLTATDLCGVSRTVSCGGSCGSWALKIGGIAAGHSIQGIAGSSDTDLWAAGYVQQNSNTGPGVLYHWDGTSWTLMTLPPNTPAIWGIRVRTANDVWLSAQGALVHYDGNGWTLYSYAAQPNLGGGYLDDVFAMSATDAFAVGQQGSYNQVTSSRVLRWNGTAWAPTPGPMQTGSTTPFVRDWHGVWAFSANDVWMVGATGYAAHFDGSAWTTVQTPATLDLRHIWGVGNVAYAAGYGSAILKLVAGTWSVSRPTGTSDPRLYGIAGNAENNVWAAGNGSAAFHFDGTSWIRDDAPKNPNKATCGTAGTEACTAELRSVYVAPNGAVWVSGKDGFVARRAP